MVKVICLYAAKNVKRPTGGKWTFSSVFGGASRFGYSRQVASMAAAAAALRWRAARIIAVSADLP